MMKFIHTEVCHAEEMKMTAECHDRETAVQKHTHTGQQSSIMAVK